MLTLRLNLLNNYMYNAATAHTDMKSTGAS